VKPERWRKVDQLFQTIGYAATAGGERFLVRSAVGRDRATAITVVVNWAAEVRR